jgi:hypothetical protein
MTSMQSALIRTLYPLWEAYKFLVLRPLYELMDTWFVWKLRNRRFVKLQKQKPIPLGELEQRICEDLVRDGISITHMDELFPGSDWLHVLTTYGRSRQKESFQNKVKTYWREMWDVKKFLIDFTNPFLHFALQDRVLGIANCYLGMYAKLHSISLSETIPVTPGTPPIQSQQWHRDIGNKKYPKVFIYFNDIEEEDGPFIYLKGSQPGGPWNKLFPQINPYAPMRGRVSDADIAAAVPKDAILHCMGKTGTIIFADTTGLHKGGYSIRNPRFASIMTFYSKASLERWKYRNRFQYPRDFEEQLAKLPSPARIAVESQRFTI